MRCAIANTGRECQFWLIFRISIYSIITGLYTKCSTTLLSLLPPSCMIAPIRDLVNIQFPLQFSAIQPHKSSTALKLPTVFHSNNAGMDIFAGFAPNDYNEVRGRTLSTKQQTSRDSSMSSTKSYIVYHERMECNNVINVDVNMDNNSPALSYETSQEKVI